MLRDRVGQTTTTQGTGDYELTGQLLKHRTFASQYANGAKLVYYVEKDNVWEANEGTLTIPGIGNPTLSRERLIASSTGLVINWPDNAVKNVIVDVPAEMFGPMGERLLLGTLDGTSTNNAIVINTSIPTPVLKDGARVSVDLAGANTVTNPTFKLNATAAKQIVLPSGATLAIGDLTAGRHHFEYKESTDRWIFLGRAVVTETFNGTLTSTDAGAGEGPTLRLDRNSASPAANDVMGAVRFDGRDGGGGLETYAAIFGEIADPTAGSEDGRLRIRTRAAGADSDWMLQSGGLFHAAATGGFMGTGSINVAGLFMHGQPIAGRVYIIIDQKSAGTDGGTATSGSWEKLTLNTEVVDQIGITPSASVLPLPAGTYRARWSVAAFDCNSFQSRLQDTTNAVTLGTGSTELSGAVDGTQTRGHGEAYFTLAGTANVELQRRVQTTVATTGGGSAAGFGPEVYSILVLEKVA